MTGNSRRYAAFLLVQTLCAAAILYNIQSAFRILLENIGTQNPGSLGNAASVGLAVLIGQFCYWQRLRSVNVPSGYQNIVLGHLFSFGSRIGFIFGGALFSLYFLRHVPALDLGYLDLIWRSGMLLAILFALYCYTLELERLGAALQGAFRPRPASRNAP
jgi:hypothetical protein